MNVLNDRYRFDEDRPFENQSIIRLNKRQVDARNEVIQFMLDGTYAMEAISCQACGSDQRKQLAERDRYGFPYSVQICRSCGLVFTSPRLNQEAYTNFYNKYYRLVYSGSPVPTSTFFHSQYIKSKPIYDAIANHTKSDANVLEVGCGAGGILKYLRDKGFRVTGLELDQEYIKYGKINHGLELKYGFIHDLPSSNRFDVIIYNHVFEHILDLAAELKAIYNRLSPDGILYIEVPGIKNLSPYHYDLLRYLQNAHTFHFSLQSLTQVCTKQGFELQSGNESIRAIFKKGHKLGPEVLNEYEDILSFLVMAESKRNSMNVRINAQMSRLRNYLYELKKKLRG